MTAKGSPWQNPYVDRLIGSVRRECLNHVIVLFQIVSSTVANILKAHGVEPAPERIRRLSWSTFLRAHWPCWEGLHPIALYQRCLRDLRGAVD